MWICLKLNVRYVITVVARTFSFRIECHILKKCSNNDNYASKVGGVNFGLKLLKIAWNWILSWREWNNFGSLSGWAGLFWVTFGFCLGKLGGKSDWVHAGFRVLPDIVTPTQRLKKISNLFNFCATSNNNNKIQE